MSEIDLDLLAALLDQPPGPELMKRYEEDPEVRALYREVAALEADLGREGARRRELVGAALSEGPAPGEDRLRELMAERFGGAAAPKPALRRLLPWGALAAAALVLLVVRPWSLDESVPDEAGPPDRIPTLSGGAEGLRLLDVQAVSPQYGELRWTPVEGDQVHYELWIWEADEAGAALDELFPTFEVKDLAQTSWTPDPELPDSILVQVHAFEAGTLLESSPSVWLRRD